MDRRKFVSQSCTVCVAIGAGIMVGSLSSCATIPTYKAVAEGNKVTVPTSLFATTNLQFIQAKGMYYNISLKKEDNGTYTALLLNVNSSSYPVTIKIFNSILSKANNS